MLKCEQASQFMSARLDGRLSSEEQVVLTAQLAECEACRAEWDRLEALDHLFRRSPMVMAPVELRVHVMNRLQRRNRVRRAAIGATALSLGTIALTILLLAPAIAGLVDIAGIAPVLVSAGPATVDRLLTLAGVTGRALLVVTGKLALPLASAGVCALFLVLALNGIWLGALRRRRA